MFPRNWLHLSIGLGPLGDPEGVWVPGCPTLGAQAWTKEVFLVQPKCQCPLLSFPSWAGVLKQKRHCGLFISCCFLSERWEKAILSEGLPRGKCRPEMHTPLWHPASATWLSDMAKALSGY